MPTLLTSAVKVFVGFAIFCIPSRLSFYCGRSRPGFQRGLTGYLRRDTLFTLCLPLCTADAHGRYGRLYDTALICHGKSDLRTVSLHHKCSVAHLPFPLGGYQGHSSRYGNQDIHARLMQPTRRCPGNDGPLFTGVSITSTDKNLVWIVVTDIGWRRSGATPRSNEYFRKNDRLYLLLVATNHSYT